MSDPSSCAVKRLFALSGNRCAFPGCPNLLVDSSGKVTGRICHIRGRSPGGPRYDPTQSEEARHSFGNLVLLCPIHHDVVDGDEVIYSVKRLLLMKQEHEAKATPVHEPSDEVTRELIGNIGTAGPGSTIVMSHHQSGGITAGTINVTAAPEPTLSRRTIFENQVTEAGYHTRFELTVQSPYPPGNLYVGVRAPSVRRANLRPQRSGVVLKGQSGTRPGFAFDNLQQPYGRIFLDVITGEPERLDIESNIQ